MENFGPHYIIHQAIVILHVLNCSLPIGGKQALQKRRRERLCILGLHTIQMEYCNNMQAIYWKPAWITSFMKDRWGKGCIWENNAFFDFFGNLLSNIDL